MVRKKFCFLGKFFINIRAGGNAILVRGGSYPVTGIGDLPGLCEKEAMPKKKRVGAEGSGWGDKHAA
jgi:hypothetical protein